MPKNYPRRRCSKERLEYVTYEWLIISEHFISLILEFLWYWHFPWRFDPSISGLSSGFAWQGNAVCKDHGHGCCFAGGKVDLAFLSSVSTFPCNSSKFLVIHNTFLNICPCTHSYEHIYLYLFALTRRSERCTKQSLLNPGHGTWGYWNRGMVVHEKVDVGHEPAALSRDVARISMTDIVRVQLMSKYSSFTSVPVHLRL